MQRGRIPLVETLKKKGVELISCLVFIFSVASLRSPSIVLAVNEEGRRVGVEEDEEEEEVVGGLLGRGGPQRVKSITLNDKDLTVYPRIQPGMHSSCFQ